MVIVARARHLAASEADSIEPLAAEVIMRARAARKLRDADPLTVWFSPGTAAYIRGLERSIRRHLIGNMTMTADGPKVDRISGIAATFYVALFSVCRGLAARFQSSNPTWLRHPKDVESRIRASGATIAMRLNENLSCMAGALAAKATEKGPSFIEPGAWDVRLADTTSVTVNDASVDLVLTSPPYCTRIDYTAATRIELAILAPLLQSSAKDLARRMIGSIRVPDHEILPSSDWGKTCNKFLETLRKHPSKASAGYYYKTHLDYFEKMWRFQS